jgi:hypothetical protein
MGSLNPRLKLDLIEATPPWEWPRDARDVFLHFLRDRNEGESHREIAADLAGDLVVMDDEIAETLLSIVSSPTESLKLRCAAAIGFGPALEQSFAEEDIGPDEMPLSEAIYHEIRQRLRDLYADTSLPKLLRRRILEAAVRAPQEWHAEAIRQAYVSRDREWVLTAAFCMKYIPGFDSEIVKLLRHRDPEIRLEAIKAAGSKEVEEAWPYIEQILTSGDPDKDILLAAMEAAACIRPREAGLLIVGYADSEDEEIAEAAEDAMSMAEAMARSEYDEEDEDEQYDEDDEEEQDEEESEEPDSHQAESPQGSAEPPTSSPTRPVIDKRLDTLQNIEFAIAQVYRADPNLIDFDAKDAIDALIRHYHAEESGRTPSPARLGERARRVFESVQEVCERRLGRAPGPGVPDESEPPLQPLPVSAIVSCLRQIQKSIPRWTSRGGRKGYLEFILVFLP